MTFGQEAIEKLSQELVGGYDLNARLLALLCHGPLDGRGQEAAVAMSQELSRVSMVSLFMLRPGDSSRMAAPGATITEGGIDQPTPTNDIPTWYTAGLSALSPFLAIVFAASTCR